MTAWVGFWIACAFCCVLTFGLSEVQRRYYFHRGILKSPNARTSHDGLIPHAVGQVFILLHVAGCFILYTLQLLDATLFMVVIVPGILTAALGLLDDLWGASAALRLVMLLLVSGLFALLAFLFFSDQQLSVLSISALITGAAVAHTWTTNVTNFMDGSDGMLALHAVLAFATGGALLFMQGDVQLAVISYLLGCCVLGFIPLNFPPARVFMGDVGSYYLGYLFFAIGLVAQLRGSILLPVWLALLLPFFIDTTVTLIQRFLGGKNVLQAHREHLYQLLLQKGFGHRGSLIIYACLTFALHILILLHWQETTLLLWEVSIAAVLLTVARLATERYLGARQST